jgi:hypothetical protein
MAAPGDIERFMPSAGPESFHRSLIQAGATRGQHKGIALIATNTFYG